MIFVVVCGEIPQPFLPEHLKSLVLVVDLVANTSSQEVPVETPIHILTTFAGRLDSWVDQ